MLATAARSRYLCAIPSRQLNHGFRQPRAVNWSSTSIVIEAKGDDSHLATLTRQRAQHGMKTSIRSSVPHYAEPCPRLTCISINLSSHKPRRAPVARLPSSKPHSRFTSQSVRISARSPNVVDFRCARQDMRARRLTLWMLCNSTLTRPRRRPLFSPTSRIDSKHERTRR